MLFHIVFYCIKNQDQDIYLLCKMTTMIYRNSSTAAMVGWKGQDSMGHKKTILSTLCIRNLSLRTACQPLGAISSRAPDIHDRSQIRKVLQSF